MGTVTTHCQTPHEIVNRPFRSHAVRVLAVTSASNLRAGSPGAGTHGVRHGRHDIRPVFRSAESCPETY